ncbi:coiled-coil domain-containing protein 43 isoform X2 [Tachyglossus aculeatus]|uniref:coiled-coil domain-containing protein 43 isoform X2 n=1 Tax=Tachyglossus aculeatus TaxID=9261 RepID=UPI0018F717BD|nr:coiled-coil domain-containing protein 43 isoform X2 [Tachyglossus aculeatus]
MAAAAAVPSRVPAAPSGFGVWLCGRLEALGADGPVYASYIRAVLQDDDGDDDKLDALRDILAAFLEEEPLLAVCQEIIARWAEAQAAAAPAERKEDEVLAIASLMEKQAQIVVKPRAVSEEEKQRKAALLAQYANVTDDEEEAAVDVKDGAAGGAVTLSSDKSLFRNTNAESVLAARKLERDGLRDEAQRKKEQDRLQREKDRLAKQERKDKEKKRTQKGERKR